MRKSESDDIKLAEFQRLDRQKLRAFALSDPYRSPEWLEFIRRKPCLFHSYERAEPHHFLGSTHGLKSSDIFTVPLCRECHEFYHRNPGENTILMTWWMILAHGWIRDRFLIDEGRKGKSE